MVRTLWLVKEVVEVQLDHLSGILFDAKNCEQLCLSFDHASSFTKLSLFEGMIARMNSIFLAWKRVLSILREKYKKIFHVKSVILV